MSQIERFMAAFEGSDAAHGQTTIGSQRRNGKTEAKSFVVRELLTEEKVKDHLEGKQGLGAIPINRENKCKFAAIDIDTYPIDHKELVVKLALMKIPMIVCRSKSGGAHLFLFLDDWYPAAEIREYLIEIASAIGHSGCEIFPKQDKILSDRGDVGNFINLPYFDSEQTMRYAVDKTGKDLGLDDFLNWIDQNRLALSDLEKVDFGTQRKFMEDGPPCLQVIVSTGAMEGVRNKVMFNFGLYLKMKYPDEWQDRFEEANSKYCKPKLPASEIVQLQKQLEKKDYFYQCSEEPMCSYCNKSLCKRRKFGIGSNRDTHWPQLSNLIKITYRPEPEYFFDVELGNNDVVQVHAKNISKMDEVKQMRKLVADSTSIFPPIIKQNEFQKILEGLWATKKDMPPPIGTNPIEILKEALIEYVNGPEATTNTAFESGSVLIEDEHYYFIFQKFYEELKRGDWTQKRDRTAHLIRQHFKGDFDCKKRFPKGDNKESFPQLRVLKLPIEGLEKEETPDEKVEIEDKKEIV